MFPSVSGEILPRVMGAGARVVSWTLGIIVRSASEGSLVAAVGGGVIGETVSGREGDTVGIGEGGGSWLTAVGRTVAGGGVSASGCSVCSGLGGNAGVGVTEGGGEVRSVGGGGVVAVGMGAEER